MEARQEIAGWLDKLGMSEYAEHFAANDIDFTILPELTDQDLKELGIASLGHRRKILKAIAELGNGPAVPPKATPPPYRRHRRSAPPIRGGAASAASVLVVPRDGTAG